VMIEFLKKLIDVLFGPAPELALEPVRIED
jgi:hypothetical protein